MMFFGPLSLIITQHIQVSVLLIEIDLIEVDPLN
jgi:hypothetical protein